MWLWNSNKNLFNLQAFLFSGQKCIPAIKFDSKCAAPKGLKDHKDDSPFAREITLLQKSFLSLLTPKYFEDPYLLQNKSLIPFQVVVQ